MKNLILTFAAVIGISAIGVAQQEELKSAVANIEKKDYIAALDDITKAKKKVGDLMTAQLASVLPQKFGEFEMQKDQDMSGMNGLGAGMTKTYVIPKPVAAETKTDEPGMPSDPRMMDPKMMGGESQITVQITTNMMMASEVMNAHSMSEGGMPSNGLKAVRIKGYRAALRSGDNGMMGMGGDGLAKTESAEAIVGGAFIRVDARGLKEPGQAEKFINAIDFDKLKAIVGE